VTIGGGTFNANNAYLNIADNWTSVGGQFHGENSQANMTGNKIAETDYDHPFNNLVIWATAVITTNTGLHAKNLTIQATGELVLGVDGSTVFANLDLDGALTQNGYRLNITGSSTTPLTGYGSFDGELSLNGSIAVSYQVQVGLPMGYLYTDRDTKISISPTRYLQVVPTAGDFINLTIKSYGTEAGYAARWVADSTGPVSYSLIAAPNTLYDIWVDHTRRIGVVQTSTSGLVQFTYNGPFSPHEFIVSTSGGPSSDLQASYEYTIQGNVVSFTDKSFGGVSTYLWDFGDGTGSTSQSPTHKYTRSGEFVVSLTVYDSSGHSSTAKTTITLVLGPDFPFERTPEGWNIWVSDNTVLSVPALALLVLGAFFLISSYVPAIPILTPKFRKYFGLIILLIGIYWFTIIDNQWLSFSWLKWPW
jgi:hypothetical protein